MRRFFHGTPLDFKLPAVSFVDRVLWTAQQSAAAQTYIPAANGFCLTQGISMYARKQPVTPHLPGRDVFWDLVLAFRPELEDSLDAVFDNYGRATNYLIANPHPVYQDVIDHIEKTLTYEPFVLNSQFVSYRLNLEKSLPDGRHVFAPSYWRRVGYLWIVDCPDDLRLYDLTNESAGDLTDPQYRHVSKFHAIEQAGYDGVIIHDFTQTPTWGPVGHISHGFFAHAIPRLSCQRIMASNFDWGPEARDLIGITHSHEYTAWESQQQKVA